MGFRQWISRQEFLDFFAAFIVCIWLYAVLTSNPAAEKVWALANACFIWLFGRGVSSYARKLEKAQP